MKNHADIEIERMLRSVNLIKNLDYTPSNVVLVTIEDAIAIYYDLMPFAIKKIDEYHNAEDRLYERVKARIEAERKDISI